MNVQITYAEIEDIIRKKVNLGLKLDYAADDIVKVSKLFGLISLKLRLSINTTNKINVEINTFSIVDKIACNNKCIGEFFNNAEEIFMKYLPDFDSREFIKDVRHKVNLETDGSIKEEFDLSQGKGVGRNIVNAVVGVGFGLIGIGAVKIFDALVHNIRVARVEEKINEISNSFNPEPHLKNAFKCKDKVIDMAKQSFIKKLVEPLQQQIDEIRANKDSREEQLRKAKKNLEILTSKKETITKQMAVFEILKEEITIQ